MTKDSGTYYGFINGLLYLIPIFPAWSIFPSVLFAGGLGRFIACKESYLVVAILCLLTSIIYAIIYFNSINHYESRDKKDFKADFRFFCFKQYILINSYLFIGIVGLDNCCYGDGQTVFAIIFSGPLASLAIFILGIVFDLSFKKKLAK